MIWNFGKRRQTADYVRVRDKSSKTLLHAPTVPVLHRQLHRSPVLEIASCIRSLGVVTSHPGRLKGMRMVMAEGKGEERNLPLLDEQTVATQIRGIIVSQSLAGLERSL